jgi:hypothetical protein
MPPLLSSIAAATARAYGFASGIPRNNRRVPRHRWWWWGWWQFSVAGGGAGGYRTNYTSGWAPGVSTPKTGLAAVLLLNLLLLQHLERLTQ